MKNNSYEIWQVILYDKDAPTLLNQFISLGFFETKHEAIDFAKITNLGSAEIIIHPIATKSIVTNYRSNKHESTGIYA